MGNRKKEQDNYTLYQKRIYNENRILIHYASFISVTVNTLAFLLSFFSEIMRSSRLIYALGAILSVVCVLLFRFLRKNKPGLPPVGFTASGRASCWKPLFWEP